MLRTDLGATRLPRSRHESHIQERGPDVDWRCQAACRTEEPELFFPIGVSGPALDQLADAKSVCHRCPGLT
jgi:hypothetical protein